MRQEAQDALNAINPARGPSLNTVIDRLGGIEEWASRRLTAELANTRDAAARWCSAVLLANFVNAKDGGARSALISAVERETCRENLRAYAAVLAGITPLAMG
ncbi:hypothetical protein AB0873_26275 [Micromonospora sp. NPDC047707]|uniref:hypothetical protein n=1 Tax=Micromonospora sp. NPDC047707 TaxID=3154498 RepID=UPI003456C8EE